MKRAYDLDANAYLLKPLEFGALLELVSVNETPDIRGGVHA